MWGMVGTEHPTARIRRTALLTCVALVLVLRDVWRMRGWADEARELERGVRERHADELRDEDGRHLERIRQLHAEITALQRVPPIADELDGTRPAAPAPADPPMLVDADELA